MAVLFSVTFGRRSLDDELEGGGVDFEGLVVPATDEFAVADAGGPGGVRLSDVDVRVSERLVTSRSEGTPGAFEFVGQPSLVVAEAGTHGFDDGQILIAPLELVGVRRLEEFFFGVFQYQFFRTPSDGEVFLGGFASPEVAIIAGVEEVSFVVVANDPEVDPVGLGGTAFRKHLLRSGPGLGVRDVGRGGIDGNEVEVFGESRPRFVPVLGGLIDQVPLLMRGVVEDLRSTVIMFHEAEGVSLDFVSFGPVFELQVLHGDLPGLHPMGAEEMPVTIMKDDRRIFEGDIGIMTVRPRGDVGRRAGPLKFAGFDPGWLLSEYHRTHKNKSSCEKESHNDCRLRAQGVDVLTTHSIVLCAETRLKRDLKSAFSPFRWRSDCCWAILGQH